MSIYLCTFLAFLNLASYRGSRVLISLFAIDLGADPFTIGILVAIYGFCPLLIAIFAGKATDIVGARFPLGFGSLGLTLGLMLPFAFPSLATLYFSAALVGTSFMFFTVAVQAFVGSMGEGNRRTRNFNILSLGNAIAIMLGPLFAGISIDTAGHASTYLYLSLAPMIPAAAFFFSKSLGNSNWTPGEHRDRRVTDLLNTAPLRKTFIVSSVVLTGVDLYSFYLPIYGHSIGLSASSIGIVLGAFGIAAFVVRLLMQPLIARFGEEAVLGYSLFVSGAAYLLFPFVESVFLLSLLSLVLGLGLGCGQPLTVISVYNRSPADRAGEAMGIRMTVNKLTQGAVPLVFGSVGTALGLIPVFWAGALILAAGGYLNARGNNVLLGSSKFGNPNADPRENTGG